jgi:hypothetical protein
MSRFTVRWSHLESRRPGARPFGVLFEDDIGGSAAGLTVDGADLLYYEQFRSAVLAMLGVVFRDTAVEASDDAQRAWLDLLTTAIPPAVLEAIALTDAQDASRGVHHLFTAVLAGEPRLTADGLEAGQVLDYQQLQAAIAHQTGRLLRDTDVEAVADEQERRRAWATRVAGLLCR